jgi:hypothetical protein
LWIRQIGTGLRKCSFSPAARAGDHRGILNDITLMGHLPDLLDRSRANALHSSNPGGDDTGTTLGLF